MRATQLIAAHHHQLRARVPAASSSAAAVRSAPHVLALLPVTRSFSITTASSNASTTTSAADAVVPPVKSARPPRPELPEPRFVEVDGKCVIKYVEFTPENATNATPTVILIHGAPGSYKDFRYLMPLLHQKNVRVLGVNLPGFDGSEVIDTENYYEHISAIPAVQSTLEGVATLCEGHENVFVLGHSFGGHAAMHFAGLNHLQQKVNLKGLFLLASAGLKPHKALIPPVNHALWVLLRSKVPGVEYIGKKLTHYIYTKHWPFPDNMPLEHYAAGIVRVASADFAVYRQHLESIKDLPSFIAWAQDDLFIQEEIFMDVASRCHPGPRFAFTKGGHNVQKTKADILALEMAQWMENVASSKYKAYTHNVKVLP
uniref:AB hydrolase-1 domain-containing protein n=1 Tax=Globisporangium ultimum (strain ATCC 200006 / CBS 805.95 / DAOM BR144) TaxID=431595 RepID=K3X737_GLOUD